MASAEMAGVTSVAAGSRYHWSRMVGTLTAALEASVVIAGSAAAEPEKSVLAVSPSARAQLTLNELR